MFTSPRLPRQLVSSLVLAGTVAVFLPGNLFAQENAPTLFLRPHCEEADQTLCAFFDIQDPTTLETPPLAPGETLDMDVVLSNPTQEAINKVRIWISYDSEALEGTTLTVNPLLPDVTPGESDFVPLSGYAKIAAAAEAGMEPKDMILPVARVIFTAKPGPAAATPLSFYDQRNSVDGHTFIATVASPAQNLLMAPLGTLLVQFTEPVAPASSSAAAVVRSSSESSAVNPPSSAAAAGSGTVGPILGTASSASSASSVSSGTAAPSAAFATIQVQNVRVGTKDSLLYVTWDGLNHPKLQGYNVYFGTLQGRYLQRRSVSLAARGTIIRDLPPGTTYYIAVRGVDESNQETAFSAEASVEIGNPSTASSPILGGLEAIEEGVLQEIAPPNPVEHTIRPLESGVPGKSGVPSGLLLLLLGSAVIGTFLALRRQMIAAKTLPV